MLMRYRSSICTIAFAAALLAMPAAAQVVDFGKYPELKGQWLRHLDGSPNNWIRLGGQPPLTPEYQKVWDEIKADLDAGGPGNWPSTFCVHQGMPAFMSLYSPAEIIVMPETTWMLINHNDDMYRRVITDGRPWPEDAEPTFNGYSIGQWKDTDGDGKYDTLEVETRFLKNPRGYDTTGNFTGFVIAIRTILLFPAVAVDAPGANWRQAMADTAGHAWDILFIMSVAMLTPIFVVCAEYNTHVR